jgi:hypothetical protein
MDVGAFTDRVQQMSERELDELPFGVITLGLDGTIKRYNKTEAELARLEQRYQLGKNFWVSKFCDGSPRIEVARHSG